ncbi:MAG: hypothetical protein ACI936_002619 [Paraglaciecola sp.]
MAATQSMDITKTWNNEKGTAFVYNLGKTIRGRYSYSQLCVA